MWVGGQAACEHVRGTHACAPWRMCRHAHRGRGPGSRATGTGWPEPGGGLCVRQRSAHGLDCTESESHTAGFSPERPAGRASGGVPVRPGALWTAAGCPRTILPGADPQEVGPSACHTPGQERVCAPGSRTDPTTWLKVPPGGSHPGAPGLDAPSASVAQRVLLKKKNNNKRKNQQQKKEQGHLGWDVPSPGRSTSGTPDRSNPRETSDIMMVKRKQGSCSEPSPG